MRGAALSPRLTTMRFCCIGIAVAVAVAVETGAGAAVPAGAGLAAGAPEGGNVDVDSGAGAAGVSGLLLKTDCAGMSGDAVDTVDPADVVPGDIGAGDGADGEGAGCAVVAVTGRVCATGLRKNNPGCAICK